MSMVYQPWQFDRPVHCQRGRIKSLPPRELAGVPQISDELLDMITYEGFPLTKAQRIQLKAEIREATNEIKRRHEMAKLGIGPYAERIKQRDDELAADFRELFNDDDEE